MAAPLPFEPYPNNIKKKHVSRKGSVKYGTIFDVFKKVENGYGF